MATFKICVRKKRADGLYAVYIRVTHNQRVGYIKTDKLTSDKYLSASGEVKDPIVLEVLMHRVGRFVNHLNRHDINGWSVQQVIAELTTMDEDVSFSAYARRHIEQMINKGQVRNARNYTHALQSMERSFGTNQVPFSQMTSTRISKWIQELSTTARCKEQYPICMRQIYKAALIELNDEEAGIQKIKFNPWPKVKIPQADTPDKKAIPAEDVRRFFSAPLPESKMIDPLPELGRDVAMMVLCLAGINTADLYELRKSDYRDGVISYNRLKTRNSRTDKAYIEMRVEPIIKPLIEKYKASRDDEYLFSFHNRYSDFGSFNANVNNGIKKLCASIGMPKEQWYSVYTFRHTWATTAQNDIGASLAEVGFAMNHSQLKSRVTRGYVKIDYSPAWRLNAKVIDFIFFSDAPSKLAMRGDQPTTQATESAFRVSPKMLIRACAFYGGKCLAQYEDIGLSNVDDAVNRLVSMLPGDIPTGAIVQFKLINMDNEKVAIYEHQKGKGF